MASNMKSNHYAKDVRAGGVNLNEKQIIENRLILLEFQMDKMQSYINGMLEIHELQVRIINNLQRILGVSYTDLTF